MSTDRDLGLTDRFRLNPALALVRWNVGARGQRSFRDCGVDSVAAPLAVTRLRSTQFRPERPLTAQATGWDRPGAARLGQVLLQIPKYIDPRKLRLTSRPITNPAR